MVQSDGRILALLTEFFDEGFYRRQLGRAGAGEDALSHYLERGWRLGLDPSVRFSTWHYVLDHPDVAAAGVNPLLHYVTAGRHAKRLVRDADGFVNAALVEIDEGTVRTYFDDAFYRAQLPPGEGPADAWLHFLQDGWRKGLDPCAGFSTGRYLAGHPDVRRARINPLLHYILYGLAEGRATWPSEISVFSGLERVREAFDAEFYTSTYGLAARDAANPFIHFLSEGWRLGFDPSPNFSTITYLARYPDIRKGDINPFVHFILNGREEGRIGGLAGATRAALEEAVEKVIACGSPPRSLVGARTEDRLRPSEPDSDLALLRRRRDRFLIERLGRFDAGIYRMQARAHGIELAEDADALDHYLRVGEALGMKPDGLFDTAFYRKLYGRRFRAGCSVYAHFLLNRHRDFVFANVEDLHFRVAQVRQCALFDPDRYRAALGLDPAVDAHVHYALSGSVSEATFGDEFDTGYYVSRYPDIAYSGMNPLVHFERFGRNEGRAGTPGRPSVAPGESPGPAMEDFPGESTGIAVVSHEASRTGAPIVALNLARQLAKRHRVVAISGADGPLAEAFREASGAYVDGFLWGAAGGETLREAYGESRPLACIVNSICSDIMIDVAHRAGVPVISLIHEFASYAYPAGTVASAVQRSDVTVFPAELVRDSYVEECTRLGLKARNDKVAVFPQGKNTAGAAAAGANAELSRRLGIVPGCKLLLGAGSVEFRKGVDIFIQTAAEINRTAPGEWRFAWIGGGYRPDTDKVYSVYLKEHVQRSGLTGVFRFMEPVPTLEPVLAASTVFFLSSRLDPFPNVVLDALECRVPVVCFEGATGASDLAKQFPFAVTSVSHLDPAPAAQAIIRIGREIESVRAAFAASYETLLETISFESYARRVESLISVATANMQAAEAIAGELAERDFETIADLCALCAGFGSDLDLYDVGELVETLSGVLADPDLGPLLARFRAEDCTDPLRLPVPTADASGWPSPGEASGYRAALEMAILDLGGNQRSIRWLLDLLAIESCAILSPGSGAGRAFGPGVRSIDSADFRGGMQALVEDTDREFLFYASDFVPSAGIDTTVLRSSRLGFPTPAALDTALGYMGEHPDCAAILMPARLHLPPADLREALRQDGCDLSLAGMSGLIRVSVLSEFLADAGGADPENPGDGILDQVGRFELRFLAFCRDRGFAIVRHPWF
ncbi:glycosyltransferase family 4 protein [Propylenella binzhouense]|uniref:Glycosyltransferase n=1 Tax=Propylenella binzhouense TaxID=2555902 RepID=A0A964WU89_9HYPH|nr:glycosyltransferase family 4 protein [Propylenella binzhouense]MYZ48605.1 glycosyltransferase [Propylenella binzhouense]